MATKRRLRSFHSSSKAADGPSAGLGAFLASWALAAIPPRQDKQNTTANSIHFFISTLLGTRSQNLLCQTDEFPLSFAWIIRKDRPGIASRHHTIGTGGCRKERKLGRTARLGAPVRSVAVRYLPVVRLYAFQRPLFPLHVTLER